MELYVGTYRKYENGSLFGEWLDLDDYSDKDDFINACLELHSDEDDPELMFQDCDCNNDLEEKFYCECYISQDYWRYKDAIEKCGLNPNIVAEYISNRNFDDVIEGIESAEENYMGTYKYFEDFLEETCFLEGVPGNLKNYIDYEAIKRDMGFDGMEFIEDSKGNIAIFNQ